MDNDLDLTYERLLGEGSYGKVFLVKQQDGEKFAVKEIDLTKCDGDGKTQALGESALLSRVKHEYILKYVESVINDDCLYIITEYCEGGDMEDYLQTVAKVKVTIPESLVTEWVLQLGAALKYLHDEKILHRDMKTKNIFLKDDLTVKLGDMGIAKVLDMNQSKADTFIGTPSYMSPELFSGKSYNHKTDIWGLGCCAYEMMTLKRAFQGKALWTLIREIKQGKTLELPDRYSLDIRTLVQEMMSQAPEDRPSATDIVHDDLLLYHRGQARDDISTLPRPNQVVEEKKNQSRNSANLSGSFNRMLQEKNQAQEENFRATISQVCEKVNTLHRTTGSTAEDLGTFVYRGDSDSDDGGELEAAGTILDSTLLQQYTQQLDTFVYKGEGDSDNDSKVESNKVQSAYENQRHLEPNCTQPTDVTLQGTLVKKDVELNNGLEEETDVDVTLVRQYSNTLEDLESEENGHDGEDSGRGPSPVSHPVKASKLPEQSKASKTPLYQKRNQVQSQGKVLGNKVSSKKVQGVQDSDEDFTSKYQYLGLRDTLALRPDKRWKRHSETDELLDRLKNTSIAEDDSPGQVKSEKKKKRETHRPISLSSSLSSTTSFSGSKMKTSDPRLHKTLSFDGSETTRARAAKVKISDRIEQSAKTKAEKEIRLRSTKQAFVEAENDTSYTLTSGDQVKDIVDHMRGNLSPLSPDRGDSDLTDTIKSSGSEESQSNQESPNGKGKKKKMGLLKKQSEARKKSIDKGPTKDMDVVKEAESNIKLFTRAQKASFSKDDDDSINTGQTNGEHKHQDMNYILTQLQQGSSDSITNEHILVVQRELASGLGMDILRQVMDIMSMVSNEEEMQLHVMNLIGHRLFEEYKQHLIVLKLLETRGTTSS